MPRRTPASEIFVEGRTTTKNVRNEAGKYVAIPTNTYARNKSDFLGSQPSFIDNIPSSSLTGAVVGVIGSGGSLPKDWGFSDGGMSLEVLEITTYLGLPALKMKVTGTPTGAWRILPLVRGVIQALPSEKRTCSIYVKTVAGTLPTGLGYGYAFYLEDAYVSPETTSISADDVDIDSDFRIEVSTTTPSAVNTFDNQLFTPANEDFDWTFLICAPNESVGANVKSPVIADNGGFKQDADSLTLIQKSTDESKGFFDIFNGNKALRDETHYIEGRTTNALVLQSDGTYVERYGPRTNAIPSDMAGSAVGVLGSGGSLPDGWSNTYVGTEVLAFDDSPEAFIDIRIQGTSPQYPALFLQPVDEASGLVTQVGDVVIISAYVTRLPGPWNPIFNFNLNLQQRTLGNVFISQQASPTLSDLALGERRLVEVSFAITDPTAVRVFGFFTSSGNSGVNRDFSVRIEKPQLEIGNHRTPDIYGPAFTVAPAELAIGQGVGLQVSQAVTNLFLNPTLQGHTSWIAGGDGDCDLTANAGLDPTGAQVATVVENQSAFNFGSQFYQGVAIVDTEMTISMWAYADEVVAAALKLNDNENNHNVTIGTTMQRFDHTGTIGPALLGGGLGRCGFQSGEDWQGKGVVIAWVQINVGGPAPFAVGTRAADNPVVVQGFGDEQVSGGDFLAPDAAWVYGGVPTSPIDVLDGALRIEGNGYASQKLTVVEGSHNTLLVDLRSVSADTNQIRLGTTENGSDIHNSVTSLGVGVYEVDFIAPGIEVWVTLKTVYGVGTSDVTLFNEVSSRRNLPYPGYNPDSQAYAKTEVQHVLNPIFEGTVGAVAPTGYGRVGSEDSSTLLPAEIIGGILCNPVSLRMGASLGYQGIGHSGGLKVGTHKVLCYIRRPADVSGERFAVRLPGGGAPSVNVRLTAAEVDAFPDDVWVRQVFDLTVTAEGSSTEFILPGGIAGQGLDLALPNIILDTTQDVETQSEQGAFSRILAGDGFASEAFPSAKDLVPGRFDSQADVDLWGPSSTDPDQMTRTEVGGVMEMVRGVGGIEGQATINAPFNAGSVYALGVDAVGHVAANTEFTLVVSISWEHKISYGIAPIGGSRLVNVWNWDPSSTVQVDSLSVQEVEPGVVFEVKAKWGAALGQHAFRFDDGGSTNIILVQKTGSGTVKLLVRADGVDVINFASAVLWPSDTEAPFRLEITKTDAGTFFALFLDGVYIADIPAGPVDCPEAINQLKLAPVEGVQTIKSLLTRDATERTDTVYNGFKEGIRTFAIEWKNVADTGLERVLMNFVEDDDNYCRVLYTKDSKLVIRSRFEGTTQDDIVVATDADDQEGHVLVVLLDPDNSQVTYALDAIGTKTVVTKSLARGYIYYDEAHANGLDQLTGGLRFYAERQLDVFDTFMREYF